MNNSDIVQYEDTVFNDLKIDNVEISDILFTPILSSKSLGVIVKYKLFRIPFESLPLDLQNQLKQIALERISKHSTKEKS
jgi:hypothetical protein